MTNEERIQTALNIAMECGGIDGGHHKAWVIDQMVRALTDCPLVEKEAVGAYGNMYNHQAFGESEQYRNWVSTHNDGEDGPNTYEWDTGIAP